MYKKQPPSLNPESSRHMYANNMWCFSEQVRVPKFGTERIGVRNNEEKHGTIKIMDKDP